MYSIGALQGWVSLALGVTLLAMEVWALLDCATTRTDAFPAADKRTKGVWLGVTGVAVLLGFLTFTNPLSLFGLLAVVGAGIYLADVRPAVRAVRGGGSGSGGRQGPYGPW